VDRAGGLTSSGAARYYQTMSNATLSNVWAQPGDLVRATNPTYGLRPPVPADEPSEVVRVVDEYHGLVELASGRLVDPTTGEMVRRADKPMEEAS
jgi:hypothetical protein